MDKEIKIEVSNPSPCPVCKKGYLLAFLRPRYKNEGSYAEKEFSHYEIYYKCSNSACFNQVEG
ncbi:MAG: hypothetical protein ABSB71_08555 [Candidatus Bathyarchaeia archaeon]|jgi:hypothetical protein